MPAATQLSQCPRNRGLAGLTTITLFEILNSATRFIVVILKCVTELRTIKIQ